MYIIYLSVTKMVIFQSEMISISSNILIEFLVRTKKWHQTLQFFSEDWIHRHLAIYMLQVINLGFFLQYQLQIKKGIYRRQLVSIRFQCTSCVTWGSYPSIQENEWTNCVTDVISVGPAVCPWWPKELYYLQWLIHVLVWLINKLRGNCITMQVSTILYWM